MAVVQTAVSIAPAINHLLVPLSVRVFMINFSKVCVCGIQAPVPNAAPSEAIVGFDVPGFCQAHDTSRTLVPMQEEGAGQWH
jgi:hypothetical protein